MRTKASYASPRPERCGGWLGSSSAHAGAPCAAADYVHERAVGNPKPVRDAWKAGDAATGTAVCSAHLDDGSRTSIDALAERGRSGWRVMCVEHALRLPSLTTRQRVSALGERLDGFTFEHLQLAEGRLSDRGRRRQTTPITRNDFG